MGNFTATFPRFDRYIEPARAKSASWRLALGVLIIAAVFVGTAFVYLGLGSRILGDSFIWQAASGRSPVFVFAFLLTFLASALAVFAVARVFHGRGVASLFGPPEAGSVRPFLWGLAIVIALFFVSMLISIGEYFLFQKPSLVPEPNLAFSTWCLWLLPALVALLIQTGTEELIFRGYLQQQLAACFQSQVIWAVLPSILFGLLHYDAEVFQGNAWVVVGATSVMGYVAAMVTAHTGSLWAAIGLHFGNNIFALLGVSLAGDFDGLALFSMTALDPAGTTIRQHLFLEIALVLAAYFLWKRYFLARANRD